MKLLKVAGVTLALLVAALVVAIAFVVSEATLYQSRLGPALERELGFAHGSPYVRLGERRQEVFTLHPTPGGTLAAAGVRNGDIVRDFSITGFYKHLHLSRGSQVTIRVMDGGDGPPADRRAVRTISFSVPPASQ
jgi:hypothetical protein